MFSKLRELDRLDEVRRSGIRGGAAQDGIVVAGYRHDEHLGMMLSRQVNQLQAVVFSKSDIDDEDVCSVFSQKRPRVFESVERERLVAPGSENIRERVEHGLIIVDEYDLTGLGFRRAHHPTLLHVGGGRRPGLR